ncbi:MAG: 50S ribosomal protein L11 methyltransferase [Solirubrobacteraceae bacterium]
MIRLAIRVERADAEIALAELLVLAPHGLEESELPDGRIEYAIYGAAGEVPELPALEAAVAGRLVEICTSEVPDDWSERWREFHRAQLVAGELWVRPPWDPPAAAGLLDVAIEPAQAFGTGAHPTTRLCLELLCALPERAGPLLDVGCGSGVLAIAAARLGFDPITAVDHERESVKATRENAQLNGVDVAVGRLDLRCDAVPEAPTILANLLLPLLLALSARIESPPRTLIAGGLLAGQVDAVAAAFGERHGMHERERRHEGEWAALLLE